MINASQEFKNLVKKGVKVVNYADITLRNGTVLNLEPSDFVIGGFSMTDKTTNGKFEIGTAIAKTISVTIANHTNKFSTYDFYKSIIYMYVAVEKEDGTVLKERKGKYYVINPTTPGDIIKLSGVDSMYLFDRPYNASTSFPATLQAILSDCCLDCGVKIGFKQFDNYNFVVKNKPTDCTYRQVVSWVAQIAGYNARISNDDYLELVWYDSKSMDISKIDGGNYLLYENTNVIDGGNFKNYNEENVIDGGNFTDYVLENITKIKSLTVSTDDVVISGVKVEYEKKEILFGTEDYVILIKDNPLVLNKENEICRYLGNKLKGISFRPLTCQITNNPLLEPYDSCYVFDRKGNEYFTLINNVSFSINGFTTISCNADDPTRNESSYVSESAKAVVQARRNAEKQISSYDKAVQNMNMLAANAMGLYRESETKSDGSVIYYMSNRPIAKNDSGVCSFVTNSVVYKMTGDGFFVSEDGGKSYTSGFDAKGNAVVNVLSAIGITFDWAKGGTLSLGGENNVNGSLVVFDAKGKQVGKWDNSGIVLPPGTTISWNQVTDNDNVANVSQIPTNNNQLDNGAGYTTKIDVNSIITNKVTASFVNALKVTAGSVAAENITGTTISGKTISGGSIKIGNYFSVDSSGNVIANSLKSSNAEITGGKIDITTSSSDFSSITLKYSSYKTYLSPEAIKFNYGTLSTSLSAGVLKLKYSTSEMYLDSSNIEFKYSGKTTSLSASGLKTGHIETNGSEITIGGAVTFYDAVTLEIGNTHKVKGNLECSGSVKTTGTQSFSIQNNLVEIGSVSSMIGFFGNSGSSKKSVSKIYSTTSATASSNAAKINEIINALNAYNLV